MIIRSILVFALASLAEIGGGYLMWLWLREGRPLWVGLVGALVVVVSSLSQLRYGWVCRSLRRC